jgi:hypothetical protein
VVAITASFIERAAPHFTPLTTALDGVIQALEPGEEAVVIRFLEEVARVVEDDAERLALGDDDAGAAAPVTVALWA